ncbi:S41 family peptidase [Quadrisphaera sp. KR29]|uniref:S41 family peptidase n=1 Tax=Quadrisphaera sp. KR29 TaxID=3461391 RepID=UPI004043FAA1
MATPDPAAAAATTADDGPALTRRLAAWVRLLVPDAHRAERLAGDLERLAPALRGAGGQQLLEQVEAACHRTARHLTLHAETTPAPLTPLDAPPPGWPPASPADVARRGAGVTRVERLAGGTGVLRLDALEEVAHAGAALRAAAALLAGADAVVLDLRGNGGGAVSGLAAVAGWLLGPRQVEVQRVHRRDGSVRQWWTDGEALGAPVPAGVPVAVLVGLGTYSSAEGLAHVLAAHRRVLVVGERTPGAADHVTPVRVAPRVTALVPEATPVEPTTGSSWEGSGVVPDLACAAGDALEVALAALAGRS